MNKQCSKCLTVLPLDAFYSGNGRCKECAKAGARKYREDNIAKCLAYDRARAKLPHRRAKNIQCANANKARRKAHSAVSNAIRDGKLTRQPCEVCGSVEAEAHHPDYTKPLDVRWLCFRHHREAHGHKHFSEDYATAN